MDLPPEAVELLRRDQIRLESERLTVERRAQPLKKTASWMTTLVAVGMCALLTASIEVAFAQQGNEAAAALLRLIQVIGNVSAAVGLVLTFITSVKIPRRYTFGFGAAYFATNPAVDAAGFFRKEALLLMPVEWADTLHAVSTSLYILGTGLILCLLILLVMDFCKFIGRSLLNVLRSRQKGATEHVQ